MTAIGNGAVTCLHTLLTNFMVNNFPWKINNYLASQKVTDFVEPKGPLPCSLKQKLNLSQLNLIHTLTRHFYKTHFSIIFLICLGHSSDLFTWQAPWSFISTMRATCPVPLDFIDLITLPTLGEEEKLWSSSLCIFLVHSVIPFLGPNILLGITFNLHSPLSWRDQVSYPWNKNVKFMVLYISDSRFLYRTRKIKILN
jgi:hypothetical protein